MIHIKGGRVVDPVTGTDASLDVLTHDGTIIAVEPDITDEKIELIRKNLTEAGEDPEELLTIDAAGLVVAPGLMDAHVHFRDPGFTYKGI